MGADARQPRTPARALLVIDRPVLAELVKLALGHGVYLTQVAPTLAAALGALRDWQPHLAVVDMDIAGGALLTELGRAAPGAARLPVIALTRRGDLKATLEANRLLEQDPEGLSEKLAAWTGVDAEVYYAFHGPRGIQTRDYTLKPEYVTAIRKAQDALEVLKKVDRRIDVGRYVDDRFIRRAATEFGLHPASIVYTIVACVVTLVTALVASRMAIRPAAARPAVPVAT